MYSSDLPLIYRIQRVIFGGQNIRGSAILRHFVGNIFVVAACTQVKVGKVASFVVRPPTTKTTNILPPRLGGNMHYFIDILLERKLESFTDHDQGNSLSILSVDLV